MTESYKMGQEEATSELAPNNNEATKEVEEEEEPRLKNPLQPISIPLETTIRMTLSAFVAYTLAVLDIPSILPPSQQWLIGLLGAVVVMRIPNMIFTVGGMLIVMYALVAFGLASATLLLYCVDVGGDALMISVATLWALWVSGLRYGPLSQLIGIFPSLLIAVIGLITLNLHRLIRDGLGITVSEEQLREIQLGINESLDGEDNSIIALLLKYAIGLLLILAPERLQGDGVDNTLTEEFGIFAGRTVNVRLDSDLFITIEGGSWWLKGFWTWSGTENLFAVMQNFLIVCSWSFLALYCAHFLPPWRTMRYQVARIGLPQMLRDTASHLKSPTPKHKWILNDVSNHAHDASIVLLTALEPRFADWRFNWPRCTFLSLYQLTKSVENAMLKALLLDYIPDKQVPKRIQQSYRGNAQALIDRVASEAAHVEIEDEELSVQDDPLWHNASAKELNNCTIQYLESMKLNPTTKLKAKDKVTNLLLVILPFLAPPILLFALIFVKIPLSTFNSLTGRERFDLQKAAYHVKFALGFCALFSVSVYWDAFHDFDVATPPTQERITWSTGNPIGSFSGWQLVAYAFATMPTTEGTLKKSVLRVFGTLIGGFSAWAAIQATGDNKIGFVAWLTVTTFGAAYLSVDKGEDAERSRMKGSSPDFGYAGFYIVLTQAVICMEFLIGIKDGNELVASRIISNLTGIVAASIMAVIPPCVRGGDPKWTQLLLIEAKMAMKESIEALLKSDFDAVAAIKKRFSKTADSLRSDANYMLQDAKRLTVFVIFRVDSRLEKTLIEAGTTSSFLSLTLDRACELAKEGQFTLTEEDRKEFELVLAHVQSGNQFVKPEVNLGWKSSVGVVSNLLRVVQRRLVEHAAVLEDIRSGTVSQVVDEKEEEVAEVFEKISVTGDDQVENENGNGVVVGEIWC